MEAKAKWKAEAKICVAILQERKTKKKTKMLRLSYYKNMRSMHSSERIEEMGDKTSQNLGDDTPQTHIHGCRKIRQQTRCWNYAEQEVEAKNY